MGPPTVMPGNAPAEQRLQDAVDLPLGTVVTDTMGVQHVFYGTRAGRGGLEHCFIPRAEYRDPQQPARFTDAAAALAHFPSLDKFVRPGISVAAPAVRHAAGGKMRLEHAVDLPLGAVLVCNKGVEHVYIGQSRNTAGHELAFMPRADAYRDPMQAHYALVDGALRKFPGLRAYLRPGIDLPSS